MADVDMTDDLFWLKFAKDHVSNAIVSRDEAAKNLDTYLKYVWGIYTGVFAISTAFSVVPGSCWQIKAIMALPIIIIPIALFFCIRVQMPLLEVFDPNEPDSIVKDLYSKIIKQKADDLRAAKWWAFFSAISIGISIFVFKLGDITKDYSVNAFLQASCNTIQINGKVPANKTVFVFAIGSDSKNSSFCCTHISQLNSDNQGVLAGAINSEGIEKRPIVFCEWDTTTTDKKIISSK